MYSQVISKKTYILRVAAALSSLSQLREGLDQSGSVALSVLFVARVLRVCVASKAV